jgi:hypothetical protein
MALYNNEAISGFPTGNLSLALLNKISPNHIHFVSRIYCFNDIYFIGKFFKTQFNDFNRAIDAVRQGHYWGVAAIRRNFSQAVTNKSGLLFFSCRNFLSIFFFKRLISFKTDSKTLNASSIHLHLDMTSKLNQRNSKFHFFLS